MTKISVRGAAIAGVLAACLFAGDASAQATRTWVSGVGDDLNPCSRTAPCKTFAGAISKTAVNGEIVCLDPGSFGSVTITKSITIDCSSVAGSILAGPVGVTIAFSSFTNVLETQRTVRLRGLTIFGTTVTTRGILITGNDATAANSKVVIEQCNIDGVAGPSGIGIYDTRTFGGELYILDTTVRNNLSTGITVAPASGGTKILVALDRVRSVNNLFGAGLGSGVSAMVSNSVFVGNTNSGIQAEGPNGAADIHIDGSTITANNIGIENGGGVNIRVSNSNISFHNGGAFSGAVQSFGNNRVVGPVGTAPTTIPLQ